MPNYYVESRVDDWNIWAAEITAPDFVHALIEIWREVPDEFSKQRVSVVNRDTWETTTILTLHCPECSTDVREDEEWMLTDTPGVYQHVDCYHPERFSEQQTT
jgi:hypothetical protein